MIEHLRKYTGLIIFVVAVLFIGLAFFGDNASFGRGGNEPVVLTVDGRGHTQSEVWKLGAAPVALFQERQMFGLYEFVTVLDGLGEGGPERLFVNRLFVRKAADEFGIHPSNEDIAAEIRTMTSFQGLTGTYDQQTYNDFITKVIGRFSLTEADFLEIVRDLLTARKLAEILGGNLTVDRALAHNQVLASDQQLTIQLSRISLEKFRETLEVTDDELKAEWETSKDRYQTDRRIKVTYVIAKPEYPELPVEEPVAAEASEEEVAAAAEKRAAEEAKLAERKRAIDTALADAVDGLLHQIEASEGKDFEKAAEENGWAVTTTDFFSTTSVPAELAVNTRSTSNPLAVGDLLFRLSAGSDVVSRFSEALPVADGAFIIARLDESEESRVKTFEEARDEVRTNYIEEKSSEALAKDTEEKAAKIREELAAGRSFSEVAEELGLEVKAHGPFKYSDPLEGESDTTVLFQTAALVEPGTLADPVIRPDGSLLIFVEKREVVKDAAREERVDAALARLIDNQKHLVFKAWLEKRFDESGVVRVGQLR